MNLVAEELNSFKQNLADFGRSFSTIFWLDSCSLKSAYGVGQYELIVGLGELSKLEFYEKSFNWQEVEEYLADEYWKFFALSYDLKSQTEGEATPNENVLNWPLISCVKPQVIVTISHDGTVDCHGITVNKLLTRIQDYIATSDPLEVAFGKVEASMSRTEHNLKVKQIKEEIAEGNMYEINLCVENSIEGFECNNPLSLYQGLTEASPTPFSSYVKIDDKHVLCASPERFITTQNDRVISQPIKGTSQRFEDIHKNHESRMHLANSIKERAEHIMIVDLVRNDLSKFSKTGTVRVDQLFGIYGYQHVNQMISTVSGELEKKPSLVEALMAAYPMGSMTGAPKHIVMEFIDALEPTSRGWYSGSIGYVKPDGNFDSNVVIRSLLYDSAKKLAKFSVGGAITFDSDPDLEYEECLLKSKAIRELLQIT
jgi:para-aminobenzoate synthetase component I